jgi:hypothetical protein
MRKLAKMLGYDQIVEGGLYRYVNGIPVHARGHLYKVHAVVEDVPSYQHKILVEALTGPDEGKLFTCTPANFVVRYQRDLAAERQMAEVE